MKSWWCKDAFQRHTSMRPTDDTTPTSATSRSKQACPDIAQMSVLCTCVAITRLQSHSLPSITDAQNVTRVVINCTLVQWCHRHGSSASSHPQRWMNKESGQDTDKEVRILVTASASWYFSSLTPMVGWQEGHAACNNPVPLIPEVLLHNPNPNSDTSAEYTLTLT